MEEERTPRAFLGWFRSIKMEILVSFSVLILAALFVFLMIALNYTRNTVFTNAVENNSAIIAQVNYDIDSYIDYMENISSLVVGNEDIQNSLFIKEPLYSEQIERKKRIYSLFETIRESRPDIANIAACSANEGIVNGGKDSLDDYEDIKKVEWYQEAMDSENGIALSSSHVQNVIKSSYKWVITLSRVIHDPATNVKSGIFFIDLNYSAISTLCNNNKIGNKGYVFIMDEEGNLIYHPQQQLVYGGLKTEITDQIMERTKDYFLVKDENDSKLYTMCTSEKTGWTVVGVAYMSELLKNSKQTRMIYVVVAVVLLIGAILLSLMIANGITKPLEELKDSMQKVEQGQFEDVSVVIDTNNEIGSLSNSFNVMTEKIQELMEANIYEQREKRKSELRALQSQINPHFLYNTLDSIIWMAEGKKTDEVVLMTSALARLLRQSISNEKEEVSIYEEIEYIKSYLIIQKMRYKDKLKYTIEVSPEILGVSIIKLVLQPLVENAIYHGIKYKNGMGHLYVTGKLVQDTAILEIIDDGVGMSQDTLLHIYDKHKVNYKSNGVGVYNVQKRLQLYYGEGYGISCMSRENVGTTITIKIPAHREGQHE